MRGNNVSTLCSGVCGEKKAGSNQEVYFYKHKRLLSEIDTLDETTAINNENFRGWSFTKKKVSIIDINTFLDLYKNEDINFLNIDVEGIDEEILLNLNFTLCKPTIIVFEDSKNFGGSIQIKEKLKTNGYSQLFCSVGSVGYYLES